MIRMKCEEFVELVTAFLDGALDPATEARFVEHIAACDGCDRYLDQIRQTVQELGELPPDSLSDEAQDRLLTAFRTWQR
ncbi:anti-sigma factor family protein [Kitasatospora sp. HPMI-4]|uniref:anti-sigma factor family protein n=1 Tax=Kitasatospora sp. HPMI-4 TaxID=3448443 RepID=UPI003F1A25F4